MNSIIRFLLLFQGKHFLIPNRKRYDKETNVREYGRRAKRNFFFSPPERILYAHWYAIIFNETLKFLAWGERAGPTPPWKRDPSRKTPIMYRIISVAISGILLPFPCHTWRIRPFRVAYPL